MIVGIDLGTTNTVVAYARDGGEPRLFPIAQLVALGQADAQTLMPSSLYAPPPGESLDADFALELAPGTQAWAAGELARARGAEVTQRHVSSAKSWLSYAGVDRRAALLPWQLAGDPVEDPGHEGEESVPRVSPVQASALILTHVARVWDRAFPEAPLTAQPIVLTVPASFDAVARELTVEAARASGMDVRLLEEPQAAFYDFMHKGGDEALEELLGGAAEALVLVCDVGGGTTDLSLMRVRADLEIDRVAVGRHLLLGGDNMDLALAHVVERRIMPEGERLEPRRFGQLVGACRSAKERLLTQGAPDEIPIALAARGAKLVGTALRTALSAAEVRQVVLDGFFPEVALDEPLAPASRAAIVAYGLPYEREAGVTRHLAAFVRRYAAEGRPTALLLNGGVFRSAAIAERLQGITSSWFGAPLRLLSLTDPDTSVALGAVAYGLSLAGRGRRIGGGAARTYFIGLHGQGEQALCVLPRGSEEGARRRVERPLLITVGEPVRFDLYAHDRDAELGAVAELGPDHERLPPLVTKLEDFSGASSQMRVVLEAQLSAIGTLELSAVEASAERPRRFALAFDLRNHDDAGAHEVTTAASRYGKRLDEARDAIESVYSKRARKQADERDVKNLARNLERIFGKRNKWDAALLRALYDILWRHHRGRRVSAEHERIFWMLAGFCLRPGVGHARDPERAAELFTLLAERLAHPAEPRSWQQFWIAWRRIAAGLEEPAQVAIRNVLDPFLAPEDKGLKKPKPFKNDAAWEMLELAAGLERVPAARRGELGGWILERTWTDRDPRLWSALGRIGARIPTYGSAHHVVAARTIERWMDHLLREKWDAVPTAPRAAIAMCRVTGDRARDLSDKTRAAVGQRLTSLGLPPEHVLPIHELVPLDDSDRAAFYGDDLPAGLRLA